MKARFIAAWSLLLLALTFPALAKANHSFGFPAVGHVYKVDFSSTEKFLLDFTQPGQLTYTNLAGDQVGTQETVHYTAVHVAYKTYMVYWTEADGTRVVHVENFDINHVWTNIATPQTADTAPEFLHLDSALMQVY